MDRWMTKRQIHAGRESMDKLFLCFLYILCGLIWICVQKVASCYEAKLNPSSSSQFKCVNTFLCLLLPVPTSCSVVCTLLIWVCICNICCLDRQRDWQQRRKLNEVRWEGGRGEMSLIRQIKADWICSQMFCSMTRSCLTSPPIPDPGVSFNFYQPQLIYRVAAQKFLFFLYYTCHLVLFEIQWSVCREMEDRVIGDDMWLKSLASQNGMYQHTPNTSGVHKSSGRDR